MSRHVLVTGHTGFKGAWLSLLLAARGDRVSGLALDPEPGALFTAAHVADVLEHDARADVRDARAVADVVADVRPDVVVHLAAQPLVRASYREPRLTFETNVMGTLNVLEAVSHTSSVAAELIVTTDKVYRNDRRERGYEEGEPLGAADPYSTSKAMADLLTQSWASSFDGCPIAVARGGNVIGGGDHAEDRLLPDLIRAFANGERAVIRYPDAVRPWQHVLDCVSGYLTIVDALLDGRGQGSWNIGPDRTSFVTVGEVATHAAGRWASDAGWERDAQAHVAEAELLALDPSRATNELGWVGALPYPESVDWTVDWHRAVEHGDDPRAVTEAQITAYLQRVKA
jgi:CDP-glucose 4,6-dehydratase